MASATQTSVKNDTSYSVSGYLAGLYSNISYTGTVTASIASVAGIPYSGDYSAYWGTLAGIASLNGDTTWDNPALFALGGAYLTPGLGVWGSLLDTTATETIAYGFSSPLPAGSSFLLVDPGASYPSYSGSFTYQIAASYRGTPVSLAGWSFAIVSPTNGATSASDIAIDAAAGTVTVSSYAGSTWPDSLIAFAPNTPITDISIMATTIPYDFWALIPPRLPSALLLASGNAAPAFSGSFGAWQITGAAVTGSGIIGNPGSGWSYEGSGALDASGATDLLFRYLNGAIGYWAVSGTTVIGSNIIGSPSAVWQIRGLGDFNNDQHTDLLFQDLTGDLMIWLMSGAVAIASSVVATLPAGATCLGLGDFDNDGCTDLLIGNLDGTLQEWKMRGLAVASQLTLGAPPAGFVYAGIGDFDGNGRSDILFKDPATGTYEAWLTAADGSIAATTVLAAPGPGQALVAIGNYTTSSVSDLIFQDGTTGVLSLYAPSASGPASGAVLGSPGANFWVAAAPYIAPHRIAPTVYFASTTGSLAHWEIPRGAFAGDAFVANVLQNATFLAAGDFTGYGRAGFLARTASGALAVYDTSGSQVVVGGGVVGALASGWSYAGVGDFNGDGIEDLLFVHQSGLFVSWLLDGGACIGSTSLGNPGAGYSLAAVADLTGDGTSDLVLKDSSGAYRAWFIAGAANVGTALIGTPAPGSVLLGTGDFNGDGKSDLLFSSGPNSYTTWDMSGAAIVGGGSFSGPGTDWTYFGTSQLSGNGCASIVFRNASTGALTIYDMADATVALTHSLPGPAPGWTSIAVI